MNVQLDETTAARAIARANTPQPRCGACTGCGRPSARLTDGHCRSCTTMAAEVPA